jgi:LacI family transcriptional regulator
MGEDVVKDWRCQAVYCTVPAVRRPNHEIEMTPSSETFPSNNGDHGRPSGRRPTMREVAAVAGVSLATVSRALNGDPKVAPELAARVQDAVGMLGYRRDLTATNLRRADRASASVGLVFDDIANPFHATLHRAIEDVARERGVLAFAGSSDEDAQRERDLVQAFCSRRVDGLVIVPAGPDHSYLLRDRDAGVAMVFVDRPPAFIDADVVLSDHAGGARAATAHLLAAGHRRIGYLGDRRAIHSASERLRGHTEALAAAGVAYDPALVRMELRDTAAARAATADLLALDHPPTAIFAAQNLITIGAVEALRGQGLRHAVALVGFDDVPLADALDPGLTVVAQDAAALGRTAAERLFARLDGDAGPSQTVLLETTLVARGSGEIAPARTAR